MTGLVCENCATPLPGGSKFCNECGTPVPIPGGAHREAYGMPTDLRQALQMATSGEYEIHHELGRGGMGSVFLAREIGLDRLVAIKVLPPSLMFDEGLIMRFKREARMVAKLHHPNIIPVYRVHHSHNLAFYTMHFVSGRSLSDVMSSDRVPSLQDVERIMMEAAEGLGYAHKRGVIHRDVKPANVLLDAEGHVHLTDFGIAKALVGNTQLTKTGAVIGTPQYMAPEQCEGKMVDGRADQYSLAVVGYQLLVGHPPFESGSMKELLYHHLFTPPKPIGAIRPDTPVPLMDAIHKSLSKDPADRFACMEDFRAAIEGKGPPVFVKWIDGTNDKRRKGKKPKRGRRATDQPTTERMTAPPWSTVDVEVAASGVSGYRRALGALAVAALSIAAVGVLAVSQGAGLAGSMWSDKGSEDQPIVELGRLDVESPAPGEDDGENSSLSVAQALPSGTDEIDESVGTNGHSPVEKGEEAKAPAENSLQPVTVDPRPILRADSLEALRQRLNEGQKLYEMQRYYEAKDALTLVRASAFDGVGEYRNTGELKALLAKADSLLLMVQRECEITLGPNRCP